MGDVCSQLAGAGAQVQMQTQQAACQQTGPQQRCFKCEGRGWCHDSNMTHKKEHDERCFFCSDCNACGGTGGIPGAAAPSLFAGMPNMGNMNMGNMRIPTQVSQFAAGFMSPQQNQHQRCFKCEGHGFSHQSLQKHNKEPGERCFFCTSCDACNGTGALPGAAPNAGYGSPSAGGMGFGGPPQQQQQQQQKQRCFKCEGHGFSHQSTMDHDKGHGERCFFCKDCDACDGTGAIAGAAPNAGYISPPAMGMGGFPGAGVVPIAPPNAGYGFNPAMAMAMVCGGPPQQQTQRCFKCEGHGFSHQSSMNHDKAHGERCFFCKDCDACDGTGGIPGAAPNAGFPPAMGFGGPPQQQPQRCFKCEGHGFSHQSSMDHDKAHGERCFFCKDCDACDGTGAINRS